MSRYASVHANPTGPGDARPTAFDIKNETLSGKLADKVIVITGTSSGIGIPTAQALALTGARLFLTARDLPHANLALASILSPGHVEVIEMDNASLDSVRWAANEILEKSGGQVNILLNNAGIMALPNHEFTEDGFEKQFRVNHLAHFLLFQPLKPSLLASATPEFSSRVVNVASSAHHISTINDSGDYNFERTPYNQWIA
jgi:NAD(P)-dependent dehydrogenase (short-subunit alcohol dehydrogenase family)